MVSPPAQYTFLFPFGKKQTFLSPKPAVLDSLESRFAPSLLGKPKGFLYRRLLMAYPEFMATYYLRTNTGRAASGAGKKQVAYISGLDNFSDKTEVIHVVDKHIPQTVAQDGKAFFEQADLLERANGRSYRSLIIAIPHEASDRLAWSQTFVDAVLKDQHAYRLAIHDNGGRNPHAHLIFCERGLTEGVTPKDFFSRKNAKVRGVSSKEWLKESKSVYLEHVRKLVPNYTPELRSDKKMTPALWRELKEFKELTDQLTALNNSIKQAEAMELAMDDPTLSANDDTNDPLEAVTNRLESLGLTENSDSKNKSGLKSKMKPF
jgi:MobA/MobL family